MATLGVSDVSFAYAPSNNALSGADRPVLKRISFAVTTGEIVAVVGPSGCGKTTLLNILAGLLKPTTGAILYPEPKSELPRCGYVFQTPSLIPWMTIKANALYGADIARLRTTALMKRCESLLSTYGLGDSLDAYPNALSGGMQQRVSLIRAVLSGARLMLLDEPFSNSDFVMRRELQSELSRLVTEEHLMAVLVTHDIEDAVRIGDKVLVLTPRPARLATEIPIPIPRGERLHGGASIAAQLADYTHQVEAAFRSNILSANDAAIS